MRVLDKLLVNILKPQLERWCWYHPVLPGDKDHASRGSASPRTTCMGVGASRPRGNVVLSHVCEASLRIQTQARPSQDHFQYPLCDTESDLAALGLECKTSLGTRLVRSGVPKPWHTRARARATFLLVS